MFTKRDAVDIEDYVVADLFVSGLMGDLAADNKIVVSNVVIVEEFDVFDYSFLLKLDWNAIFEVVEDFLGVFAATAPKLQLV